MTAIWVSTPMAAGASADPMPPAVTVDIRIDDRAWPAAVPGLRAAVRRAARAALKAAPVAGPVELAVTLTDDAAMRDLNRTWRKKDKPTNVLSFPLAEGAMPGEPNHLGDVVLARQTVEAEAAAQGKPVGDHLAHLVVHGVLHLLGFDHESAREARAMEGREVAVLAGLGIADPYHLGVR